MNKFKGEISIALSTIFFAGTAVFAKLSPHIFSGGFLAFFRFFSGIILGIIFLILTRTSFKFYNLKYLFFRGFFGSLSMLCYFTSIVFTSPGRATLLMNTYPVFVLIIGILFFNMKWRKTHLIKLLICILGVFLIFYDNSPYPIWGDIFGILSAIFAGVSIHFIKLSRAKNNAVTIYLAACFIGLFITSFFGISQIHQINWIVIWPLLGIGVTAFIGQILMSYGYKYTDAITGSLISYLTIPLTMVISYLLGEVFTGKFFIGTAFIIMALIIHDSQFIYTKNFLRKRLLFLVN